MNTRDVRQQPLLTVRQVAARLAASQKTVRRLIDRDELCAVRINRSVRVTESELATSAVAATQSSAAFRAVFEVSAGSTSARKCIMALSAEYQRGSVIVACMPKE